MLRDDCHRLVLRVVRFGARTRLDDGIEDVDDRAAGIGVGHVVRCLLYTSDAADERSSVDLGGRRIIKKKRTIREQNDCNIAE